MNYLKNINVILLTANIITLILATNLPLHCEEQEYQSLERKGTEEGLYGTEKVVYDLLYNGGATLEWWEHYTDKGGEKQLFAQNILYGGKVLVSSGMRNHEWGFVTNELKGAAVTFHVRGGEVYLRVFSSNPNAPAQQQMLAVIKCSQNKFTIVSDAEKCKSFELEE